MPILSFCVKRIKVSLNYEVNSSKDKIYYFTYRMDMGHGAWTMKSWSRDSATKQTMKFLITEIIVRWGLFQFWIIIIFDAFLIASDSFLYVEGRISMPSLTIHSKFHNIRCVKNESINLRIELMCVRCTVIGYCILL